MRARKHFAIGESDYKTIIGNDFYYVDKTLFIKEIIELGIVFDGKRVWVQEQVRS